MIRAALLHAAAAGLFGGIAALLVWGLCAVLRHARAPGWLLCALWLAVGVRFAVPGGVIPVPVAEPQNAVLQQAADTVEALSAPITAPAPTGDAPRTLEDLPARETDTPAAAFPAAAVPAALWLGGTVLFLARGIRDYRRLRRRVALACKTPDGCYSAAAVTAPFTLGVLRPRIYLPADLQGQARAAVVLHERAHIRRGDPLLKPLYYLVVCLHWWNPLAWLAFRELGRAMEQACDEAALRGRTTAERAAYCESLLRFATPGSAPGTLAFGQSPAKRRILHALRYRQPGKAALSLCLAAAVVAAALLLARPTRAAGSADSTAGLSPVTTPAPSPAPDTTDTSAPGTAVQDNAPADSTPTDATPDEGAQLSLHQTAAGSFIVPVANFSYLSRYFSSYHHGDDICAPQGTPVMAAADGTVVTAESHGSYGNYAVIDHGTIDGHRWRTLYAHLDSLAVTAGQTVTQGETIGAVGSSGNATGNALHLELYCDGVQVAPRLYIPYTDTLLGLPDTDGSLLTLLEDPAMLELAIEMTGWTNLPCDGQPAAAPLAAYTYLSCGFQTGTHEGLDYAAEAGTAVQAAADGIVLATGWDNTRGYYLLIYHGRNGDGASVVTFYSQLAAPTPCAVGMPVKAGNTIGSVGTTGMSTGPHLHYALWIGGEPADPQAAA